MRMTRREATEGGMLRSLQEQYYYQGEDIKKMFLFYYHVFHHIMVYLSRDIVVIVFF